VLDAVPAESLPDVLQRVPDNLLAFATDALLVDLAGRLQTLPEQNARIGMIYVAAGALERDWEQGQTMLEALPPDRKCAAMLRAVAFRDRRSGAGVPPTYGPDGRLIGG